MSKPSPDVLEMVARMPTDFAKLLCVGDTAGEDVVPHNAGVIKLAMEIAVAGLHLKWQPIDTAPKDGTPILLCKWRGRPQGGWQTIVGYWTKIFREKDEGLFTEGWSMSMAQNPQSLTRWEPTHWMPLPPPPAEGV